MATTINLATTKQIQRREVFNYIPPGWECSGCESSSDISDKGYKVCVSQQYRWHMMIEAEWEDMWQTNSPRDIFICYAHYFQLNLDETCFLCNEGELNIIGDNDKPHHDNNCSDLRFSITVLWVGSAAGVNVPVIFLAKGKKMHPRLRGNNLVTKYVLP